MGRCASCKIRTPKDRCMVDKSRGICFTCSYDLKCCDSILCKSLKKKDIKDNFLKALTENAIDEYCKENHSHAVETCNLENCEATTTMEVVIDHQPNETPKVSEGRCLKNIIEDGYLKDLQAHALKKHYLLKHKCEESVRGAEICRQVCGKIKCVMTVVEFDREESDHGSLPDGYYED